MNHTTVATGFYISLLVGLPAGTALMILWMRKIYKPLYKSVEKQSIFDLDVISLKAIVFMLPGLFVMILFSVPAFYFGALRKQEKFCRQVIEVNKLTETDAELEEKCGNLDVDELFADSRVKK